MIEVFSYDGVNSKDGVYPKDRECILKIDNTLKP